MLFFSSHSLMNVTVVKGGHMTRELMNSARDFLKRMLTPIIGDTGKPSPQRSKTVDRKGPISVLPKNLRPIALYAVSVAAQAVVLMDGKRVTDFSERGPLTRRSMRSCINFEIHDGDKPILGFHDHPNEMWISQAYSAVADHCAEQGWLKIDRRCRA